jgi:hypothetical protein
MNIRLTTRTFLNASLLLIGALVALSLFVLLVNLSWFDEPLRPELVSLQTPRPVSMKDNSWSWLWAFLPLTREIHASPVGRSFKHFTNATSRAKGLYSALKS